MENNELREDVTKAKSNPQFNARISEDLKLTIDEIASNTGKSKPELLNEFVLVYQTKRADDEFADIDLSKYDNLSNPLKESIHNSFNHILNAVNGNLSVLKQAGIQIEEEKIGLSEREETYKIEIASIKSNADKDMLILRAKKDESDLELNAKIELWKTKASELDTKNTELSKEFDNVNIIAEQVQVITSENKELRELNRNTEASHKLIENELNKQIKSLSHELAEAKQSIFKVVLENDNKDKEIKALKESLFTEKNDRGSEVNTLKQELLTMTHKLSSTQNEYSKTLGKLEILEKE